MSSGIRDFGICGFRNVELCEMESCLNEMSFLVEICFSLGGLALFDVLKDDDCDLLLFEFNEIAFEDRVLLLVGAC